MKFKLIILVITLFLTNNLFAKQTSALSEVKPYSITFSVENIKTMKAWYVNTLGFKVVQEKNYPKFNTSLVFLELNGYRVELIKDANAKKREITRASPPAHTSIWGQSQFCFLSSNVDAVKAELVSKGVNIEWEFANKELGVKFIFIRDIEGNLIQYLERI